MGLRDSFAGRSATPFIIAAAIWAVAVYGYEFKGVQRPKIAGVVKSEEKPAPDFGLANVDFTCAAQHGFVTALQMQGSTGSYSVQSIQCESPFTEATTRCPMAGPMQGYGDQIKCPEVESVHCHGGPLQTLGLFKDDSFCGDITDRDLGPPADAPRSDD